MANTNLMLKLAELLDTVENVNEDETSGFSMECFFHECNTPSCIAGHLMYMENVSSYLDYADSLKAVSRLLDIEMDVTKKLCIPSTNEFEIKNPWQVNAKEAAKVVRNLAETGKVDWTIVCGTEYE